MRLRHAQATRSTAVVWVEVPRVPLRNGPISLRRARAGLVRVAHRSIATPLRAPAGRYA